MQIVSTDPEKMIFVADDGNEYPLIDESNDVSLLNRMVKIAENAIDDIKDNLWKEY